MNKEEKNIKLEVCKKLKKHGFDRENGIGILVLLEKDESLKCYELMNEYLDKEDIDRNSIFEYAFEITGTEMCEYVVED